MTKWGESNATKEELSDRRLPGETIPAPFGGYRQSGIGRQCGIEGLEIFTETKTVAWPARS